MPESRKHLPSVNPGNSDRPTSNLEPRWSKFRTSRFGVGRSVGGVHRARAGKPGLPRIAAGPAFVPFDRRPAAGFTLIELLLVIALIALLASLLLPALARAKDRARQTLCLSNAHQLSLGVMLYAEDHEEVLPPSTDYALPSSVPERIWPVKVLPHVQSTAVFACPSARLSAFPSNWMQRGRCSIGYTTGTAFDPENQEGFPSTLRISEIGSPVLTPLFGDTPHGPTEQKYRGYVFDPYNGTPDPVDARFGTPLVSDKDLVARLADLPASALKPLQARHAGRAMLLLADGHARAYSTSGILAQQRGAGLHWRFRPWTPPAAR